MQVKSIAQYFRPSLSYRLSLRSLFCLFLSGRLRQVLLYFVFGQQLSKEICVNFLMFFITCPYILDGTAPEYFVDMGHLFPPIDFSAEHWIMRLGDDALIS